MEPQQESAHSTGSGRQRPRIGLLGIMQELYDDMLPGITERQGRYAQAIARRLEGRLGEGTHDEEALDNEAFGAAAFKESFDGSVDGSSTDTGPEVEDPEVEDPEVEDDFLEEGALEEGAVEVVFPGPARNRRDIEARMRRFEEEEVDGVLVVMLTYGPALRALRAVQETDLPLMLANVQPRRTVTEDWDMAALTYNQGIHGAQDLANTLVRLGVSCPVVTADWRTERFRREVLDWACAARAERALRGMRIAQFGQMPGMGDVAVGAASLREALGPQVDQLSLGRVHRRMEAASEAEVQSVIEADHRRFEVGEGLSEEAHRYAARFQVGIEAVLREGGYDGFSMHFDAVGEDGRFEQLHMLAASNLMAKGYGYAAEGDVLCASLVAAGQRLAEAPHFTEMYAMDFERGSVFQSHMGEGNWRVARPDRPVRLLDRELGIGGLSNPPTVVFQAKPGPATQVSLAPVGTRSGRMGSGGMGSRGTGSGGTGSGGGGEYRLVVATGEILDTEALPNVEMPYFHFRPETGLRECLDRWLEAGGTHHQCLHLGDQSRRWERLGEMAGLDVVHV